jgi:predicted transcriptional regulator of viral defense system
MEIQRAFELLGGYTAGQWGLVTSRQARDQGVDAVTLLRLKKAGFLEIVRHGVYAVTASPTSDARDLQAAWLALRPGTAGWARPKVDPDGGVISHRSALRLHGLGELVEDGLDITVPRRRTQRDGAIRFHRKALTDTEVTVIDGLPVTTVLRTIRDLLDEHIDASHAATIIREAVEAGLIRLDTLAAHLSPYARRYGARPADGTALLEHLLAQIGLSVTELATRPSPVTGDQLENKGVTWGDLANLSPRIARRLGIKTAVEPRLEEA